MSKKCSSCNKWLVAGKCSVCPTPVATVVAIEEEEVVESNLTKAVETAESKPKVESNEKVDYESEFSRLKTEIGEATKNQAFERAVELRDELRALEKRKEEEDAAAAAAKEAHNDDSSSSDDSELANELSIEQQRANILAQLDEAKADQNFELCLELKQQLEALTSNNDGEDDEENSPPIDTTNETTNPSIEEQCQELRKQLEIAKANQEFEVCLQLKQQIEQLQKSNEKTPPQQQQQQPSNQNTPPPIPSSAPPPKPTAPPPATLSIDSKPEVPKSAPPPIPSSAPPPKSQLAEAVPYEEDNTPTRRRKSRRRKDSDRVDKPNRTESSRRRAEKESDINDIISPRSRKIKSHRSSRSHRQDPSQTATKSPVAQAREEAEALERLQLERALSGASEETSKPKFKSDDLLRQKCVELERDIAKLESAPPDDTDAQLKLWDAQTALRAVQAELAGVNDADELDDAPNTPASPLNNGEKTVSNDNDETPLSPKINSNTANSSLNSSPAAATSITKRPSRPMLKKTGNTKQLVPRPKVDNASQIKQPNAEDVYMSGWLTSKRQKRYLVLQGKVLYWFKLEQTQIPVEQLRANAQKYVLIHSQSIDAPHDKPTLLQLGAADPAEKPYEFTAPSNEIRDKWHDALCLAQRVRLSGDELPAKSEHSKGKFNTFKKKLFRKKEGEEVKGRDIGIVTGVKHTGHAGFDASKGKFDTRGLPPQLQELFDSVEKALASAGATGITADEAKEILKMAAKDPTLLQKLDEDAAAQQSDDVAVTPSNDVQTTDVSNNNNNSEQVAVVANNTNNSNGDVARESRREKRRQEKRAEFERKKLAKLAEREKRRKERAMKKMMAFSEADAKANNNNATNQTAAGNDDDDEESTDDSATEEYDAMVLDDSDESSSYIEEAQPSQQPSSTNDTDTSTAVVDASEATPANNESTQNVEQSSPAATPPVTAPPAPAPPKQPIASVTPKKQTPSGGLGGDLLSAIRAGTDLKKVEAGSNKPVKSGGGIGDMIAQALLERRKALVVKDTAADEEDSDSDWD